MNLIKKYNKLTQDLSTVKKQMVFEFAQHLFFHYAIVLCVENNSILIRTDNLKYNNMSLIDFFEDEFKDYHVHAGLLFELSEIIGTRGLEDVNLGTPYFLNFVNIF